MVQKTIDSEKEFKKILQEYAEKYDVEGLSSPNDVANLHNMIRNQILIQRYQGKLDGTLVDDKVTSVDTKKLLDSIVALSEVNIGLERQLGIDRKTRKTQQQESFPEYLAGIKHLARQFLDNEERLTKVYCKGCQVMVGRISGVYDTTYYTAAFECPQCKKQITITRKERDVFFDVKNADWRRKYPIEIVQPKRIKNAPDIDVPDDIVIGGLDDAVTPEA